MAPEDLVRFQGDLLGKSSTRYWYWGHWFVRGRHNNLSGSSVLSASWHSAMAKEHPVDSYNLRFDSPELAFLAAVEAYGAIGPNTKNRSRSWAKYANI